MLSPTCYLNLNTVGVLIVRFVVIIMLRLRREQAVFKYVALGLTYLDLIFCTVRHPHTATMVMLCFLLLPLLRPTIDAQEASS